MSKHTINPVFQTFGSLPSSPSSLPDNSKKDVVTESHLAPTSASRSRAPSPPLPSCIVKLRDLKNNPELNGKIAIVGEYNGQRYSVIPIKKDGNIISVLPDKIRKAKLSEIQGGGRKRKSHKNKYSKRTKRSKRSKRSKRNI